MSQVIGPCYMQQRLLICPCYVDSVPERTTLAQNRKETRRHNRKKKYYLILLILLPITMAIPSIVTIILTTTMTIPMSHEKGIIALMCRAREPTKTPPKKRFVNPLDSHIFLGGSIKHDPKVNRPTRHRVALRSIALTDIFFLSKNSPLPYPPPKGKSHKTI